MQRGLVGSEMCIRDSLLPVSSSTGTKIELPAGLTQKVINNMPYVASYNSTFMVSTSMASLKVNPYENVKTNTQIDLSSVSTLSYNPSWIEASVVKSIYQDLQRHLFDNITDIYSQKTDLIQLTFNGSTLEKDATTTDYPEEVKIGLLDASTVLYHHPYSSTAKSRENSLIIPCTLR
eukprot:TRINITY_DN67490_c0_g1_i1.p1 TRINITY_DN67490_c0_g1~~TRINITY_DN67490_c0_g1_i1.p1  ORF type:complete len:177 (+),score=28.70 TRINITY_DN67490_c0_g1_i1:81-611(+)